MKLFKNFYYFSSNERRSVFLLLALIVVFQIFFFTLDFIPKKNSFDLQNEEITQFQKEIDSLKWVKLQTTKPKIYPFNPNFLTDYKAYSIGLSPQEFDKLQVFRAKDKFANSAREFQNVTGISDSLLAVIQPYFKFPDWVSNKKEFKKFDSKNLYPNNQIASKNTSASKIDINLATKEQLMEINGIGDKLSDRIITYRTKLQGFSFDDQLYEVWNVDKEVVDKVLQRFSVLSKPTIVKTDINSVEFKVLMKLPYMDYELTKKIFNYKNAAGKITSLENLKKIEGFPVEKYDRIILYLKTE